MPTISLFLGIKIAMNYNDHLPPHFHAEYAEYEAQYTINPVRILEGDMPTRADGHIREWAELHAEELLQNWELARAHKRLRKIEPLE